MTTPTPAPIPKHPRGSYPRGVPAADGTLFHWVIRARVAVNHIACARIV